ncbi:MAG TPA: pantoate--beta-alanine ligase [Steroidobacteraceae bacterium]|jgi:pantoate--beta-alanine ligase|nr:pantoate--beta-alanine ligase [Steroidobacteraceae bacterium]
METVETIAALRAQLRGWQGQRLALVPTMGNLHAGHLGLLAAAQERAERSVVSLFVNPLQFGPQEDFARYPRTLERDARALAQAGCDLLFVPSVAEIYPDGEPATRVQVRGLSETLEGRFRPGHFDGVATVVAKLLILVGPDVAIFGEKDFQQLLIVRRLVADLALSVQIVGAPTARDPDGLALSSRNQYLSPAERTLAPRLHRTLADIAALLRAGLPDESARTALEQRGMQSLTQAGFRVDYIAIRDAADLSEPHGAGRALVVLGAAWLGSTRLIDNVRLVT